MRIDAARLGRIGELWAAVFYLLRGYRIVGRNVRLRGGEIDLVLRRGRTLVVAEVKSRQCAVEGHLAVGVHKRARLMRLADEVLARTRGPVELRYDILSLHWTGWRFMVSHYPDAFRPVSDPVRPWKWQV
jgi:putative endonuclease